MTRRTKKIIFGGRLNTPLVADVEAFHPAKRMGTGKNALCFDGRVGRVKWK